MSMPMPPMPPMPPGMPPAGASSFGASEIIASVVEAGVSLQSPPRRIAFPDIPIPFSPALERPALPSAQKIVTAVTAMIGGRR